MVDSGEGCWGLCLFLGVWDLGPLPSEDSPCWLWIGDCFLDQGQILPALGLRQTVLEVTVWVGGCWLLVTSLHPQPSFSAPLKGLPLPTRRPRAFGRTASLHQQVETSCGRPPVAVGSFLGCSVPPCSFGRELRSMGGERPPRTKPWSFGDLWGSASQWTWALSSGPWVGPPLVLDQQICSEPPLVSTWACDSGKLFLKFWIIFHSWPQSSWTTGSSTLSVPCSSEGCHLGIKWEKGSKQLSVLREALPSSPSSAQTEVLHPWWVETS